MIDLFTPRQIAAESRGAAPIHPLLHAAKWIAADLASTLAFVGLYALTHSAAVATTCGLAAGVAQIGYIKHRRGTVDAMQWLSLGLVAVFGAASLLTRDPRFIMLKPTLIYAAVGVVMLRRGWMTTYMPPIVLARSADIVVRFGYVWAAAMFATAALNFSLAINGDQETWTRFITVFPLASKIALVLVQYAVTKSITKMRRPSLACAAV